MRLPRSCCFCIPLRPATITIFSLALVASLVAFAITVLLLIQGGLSYFFNRGFERGTGIPLFVQALLSALWSAFEVGLSIGGLVAASRRKAGGMGTVTKLYWASFAISLALSVWGLVIVILNSIHTEVDYSYNRYGNQINGPSYTYVDIPTIAGCSASLFVGQLLHLYFAFVVQSYASYLRSNEEPATLTPLPPAEPSHGLVYSSEPMVIWVPGPQPGTPSRPMYVTPYPLEGHTYSAVPPQPSPELEIAGQAEVRQAGGDVPSITVAHHGDGIEVVGQGPEEPVGRAT